ncbi:MAG: HPr(Ser) kinase/phosphatase [Myxococcales bacterium]|jgi:HPr kinase/phosphorylase|nr:HPr(Ser) kinase/phosphatase [Myxococcales bacterium]MBL0193530.1 HPr(Ser) kinase/phosphatase [Myxococcales bacterium]HQY64451.1 HPr(Ser) kinase/phosphatase [Polyangiaceae bacterium]
MSARGEVSEAPPPLRDVSVADALSDGRLGLPATLHAGASGLGRPIQHPRVQKNGLALAGHFRGLVPTRVQVLGETELSYLEALSPAERAASCRAFFGLGLSVVVVTRGVTPAKPLVAAAEASGTPLFVVHAATSRTINALHASLDELLAPSTQLHGVLVDVFGVGLLLLGKSGIGKSECALELVLRGHRLVADDVVRCDWRPPGTVFGAADEVLRHHVEVRGLGILNVKDMFGVTAVRARKRIDVVVRLEEWSEQRDYDRLGVDDAHHEILATPIRLLTVPVRPGREMGTILEMAARDELLRRAGTFSARTFLERLNAARERAPSHVAAGHPDGESIAPPRVDALPSVPARRFAPEGPTPETAESSVFLPDADLLGKDEE